MDEALRLDPDFGMARILRALYAQMDQDATTRELNRGVVDAAKGSGGEVVFAVALRASRIGNFEEAPELFRTARQLLPGDPVVATFAAQFGAGNIDELNTELRQVATDFPDWAAPYNALAYNNYRAGNRTGALMAVKKYMELAPDHPNSHDSYAEMMQWEGRFEEAVAHYRRALSLDATYAAGYTGIADARQQQGRGADARAALTDGLAHATTPAARAALHRLIALSCANDGNLKAAESALGEAMKEATGANLAPLTANLHRDFAMVNVMTGTSRGVAGHLTAAGAANPTLAGQHAMILAVAGMNAEATSTLDGAMADPAAARHFYLTQNGPVIRALLLVNEGRGDAALAELSMGDITLPAAEAVAALAEQQRKNTGAARLLRDRVMSNSTYSIGNTQLALARTLAARVK
jgi:tetratricopeptide (TPR) repeat protein